MACILAVRWARQQVSCRLGSRPTFCPSQHTGGTCMSALLQRMRTDKQYSGMSAKAAAVKVCRGVMRLVLT